ncbi:hypothetical protein HPB49_006721 [Dermacentor silvarum]|uniref:Uncharacterized protein n=1 Tax=Dermacentor silvarum TaxID=543639 RepID=A0ACB8DIN5_DERSI|nr:hypothetical protein HPB49_006721 [Dermacentor silvarum]
MTTRTSVNYTKRQRGWKTRNQSAATRPYEHASPNHRRASARVKSVSRERGDACRRAEILTAADARKSATRADATPASTNQRPRCLWLLRMMIAADQKAPTPTIVRVIRTHVAQPLMYCDDGACGGATSSSWCVSCGRRYTRRCSHSLTPSSACPLKHASGGNVVRAGLDDWPWDVMGGDLGWSSFEAREARSKAAYEGRLRLMNNERWARRVFLYTTLRKTAKGNGRWKCEQEYRDVNVTSRYMDQKSNLALYRVHKTTISVERLHDNSVGRALLFQTRAGALRTKVYRRRFDQSGDDSTVQGMRG